MASTSNSSSFWGFDSSKARRKLRFVGRILLVVYFIILWG
jgi:hypothetical protein